eukprot:TRINITY_DN3641_c0_g1_i1.p1 TRINITY_DN3641_c0_g1~~TRINITY_DN3641_c0_g1_i1.p1  ORF type:complete len:174 (+),score=43.84 TRINITY_DN3641_c0_g1_i1:2-523(+)
MEPPPSEAVERNSTCCSSYDEPNNMNDAPANLINGPTLNSSQTITNIDQNLNQNSSNPNPTEPEPLDRGFTDEELQTCIKVLKTFHLHPDLLNAKEYKELRGAGIIFVEGISKKYFQGMTPDQYNHKKQRKIARKARQKQQAEEDQRRIRQTDLRKKKNSTIRITFRSRTTIE